MVLAEQSSKAPQLPAALQKCLQRSLRAKQAAKKAKSKAAVAEAASDTPPPAPSADALVLANLKSKQDREACAYQLLKWHEDQRAKVAKK
jgi:hypothetical protein